MSARKRVAPKGRTRKSRAFVYAAMVHAIVLIVLITSTNFSSDSKRVVEPQVSIVKAKAIDQKTVDEEVNRLKEAEVKQRRDREKRRRNEEEKIANLKRERELLEKNKKEEKRRAAAVKEKIEQQEKELAERKKRDAEEKRRLVDERNKIKEEQAKMEAEKAAEALRLALENEEKELANISQMNSDDAEITRYIEAVRTRVENAFIYPDLEGGLNCTLYVRMIPGGDVVEARVIKSSGNESFDRQAENAVRRAAPLPVPSNPRLFQRMREIKFVFDPEH